MEHRIAGGEIKLGRLGGSVVLILLGAFVLLGGAFQTGALETLGYENRRLTYDGFATGSNNGSSFGLKYFYFFPGQQLFAEYDVDVARGAFEIVVNEPFGGADEAGYHQHVVASDERGEAVFTIEQGGLYAISFDGSVLHGVGKGYDVSFDVRWGLRG